MAWIELDRRTGFYKIGFRLAERKFKRSLQTTSRKDAEAARGMVDQTLHAIERGWTHLPADVDIGAFVLSGGRLQQAITAPKTISLGCLFDTYFNGVTPGSLEDSTIGGMKTHRRLLEKHFGKSAKVPRVTATDLQEYIDKRAHDKGIRGRRVTPVTIKKAIVTLRTVWNWGRQRGLIDKTLEFPARGLTYPKGMEKRQFMTFTEVERRVGNLAPAEATDLWECVFLSLSEIDELLQLVRQRARHSFVFPMFVFDAHTGARRSEMLRSKLNDLDFERKLITIHERKKSHDRRTTRQVPISAFLANALQDWLSVHPGGEYTFCQPLQMSHSRVRSETIMPLTRDEAHDHFKRTLAGTKWEHLRGWHMFRHSFCSNCAAKGIDQRIINAWVGHLSDEMVRRYRHLLPDQQRTAIDLVFASN